jgi:hypothetical protein
VASSIDGHLARRHGNFDAAPLRSGGHSRTLAQGGAAARDSIRSNYSLIVGRILRKLKQVRFRSFSRSDQAPELKRRTVENDDALAQRPGGGEQFPPNYVRPADEGRPRH